MQKLVFQAGYPQGPMPGMPQGGYNPGVGAQMEGSPVHQLQQGPSPQMQGYLPQQMYAPPGGAQVQYTQQVCSHINFLIQSEACMGKASPWYNKMQVLLCKGDCMFRKVGRC